MLKEKIYGLWKEAFKAKDNIAKSAYESIKTRILNEEKSGKYELPIKDDIVVSLIIKEVKELKETQSFIKDTTEEYQVLNNKINLLSEFLPKPLSEDEVINIIKNLSIKETNKGKLIGLVVKEVGNRFDKSKIAQLVNKVINNN